MSFFKFFLTFCLLCTTHIALTPRPCQAQTAGYARPVEVSLPSALPSGNPVNDRVLFTFYPVQQPTGQPTPAVVLLHYLGVSSTQALDEYARYLGQRGIAAVVMTLPYHLRRLPPGPAPFTYYVGNDVDVDVHSYAQGASDVSTIITWLNQQASIDAHRIGVVGISLGAIITHLVMGQDARISAGVALLGGGDFPDTYRRSLAGRLFLKNRLSHLTPAMEAKLRQVDPLTYADQNRPRRVLMVQAARDSFIPPHDAEELWEALGRPPIEWLDTNHTGIFLAARSAMRAATTYLQGVWSGSDLAGSQVPLIHAPTIKVGLLFGLDSLVTPAITYQALALGTRHHMALLHTDLGWSGRGPFVGVATTVSAFADVGLGRRFSGRKFRPYTSLHIVF